MSLLPCMGLSLLAPRRAVGFRVQAAHCRPRRPVLSPGAFSSPILDKAAHSFSLSFRLDRPPDPRRRRWASLATDEWARVHFAQSRKMWGHPSAHLSRWAVDAGCRLSIAAFTLSAGLADSTSRWTTVTVGR